MVGDLVGRTVARAVARMAGRMVGRMIGGMVGFRIPAGESRQRFQVHDRREEEFEWKSHSRSPPL